MFLSKLLIICKDGRLFFLNVADLIQFKQALEKFGWIG